MSIPTEYLSLFKADWIGDPDRLKALARHHKYNDLFTAELAAWCAEVHEHLRRTAHGRLRRALQGASSSVQARGI